MWAARTWRRNDRSALRYPGRLMDANLPDVDFQDPYFEQLNALWDGFRIAKSSARPRPASVIPTLAA